MGQSSNESFVTKTKLHMSAQQCMYQNNQSQVKLLKCHCYNIIIETNVYSSAIDLHTWVYLTEVYVSYCLAGS